MHTEDCQRTVQEWMHNGWGSWWISLGLLLLLNPYTAVMTELSVSQSDPEVSGDITGGKITCLWQTDDEQNKNPGLLSLRPDPFFFFFWYHLWYLRSQLQWKNISTNKGKLLWVDLRDFVFFLGLVNFPQTWMSRGKMTLLPCVIETSSGNGTFT